MNRKVLIRLMVPEIEEMYDIYIPINRRIGSILNLFYKSLNELSNGLFVTNKKRNIYNRFTGNMYNINDIVRETDIRNGTVLVLI